MFYNKNEFAKFLVKLYALVNNLFLFLFLISFELIKKLYLIFWFQVFIEKSYLNTLVFTKSYLSIQRYIISKSTYSKILNKAF